MIEPVTKINVVDHIFDKMMQLIASGEWKVGDKIPSENEMKAGFNVGRNSIRQAIHRVSALGLLESKQGEGTYVKKIDLSFYMNILIPTAVLGTDDAIMLFHLQRAIQVESAQWVCEYRTDDQAEQLLSHVDQMKRSFADSDKIGYLTADLDYHALFVSMTGNHLFVKLTEIIRRMLYFTLRDVVFHFDSTASIRFHGEIAEAVKRRDSSTAITQMTDHMDDVIAMIDKLKTDGSGLVAKVTEGQQDSS
jgi:GntR family transcriptional regulator, transcriptional repressor for pyruvate dehydrogenase complex